MSKTLHLMVGLPRSGKSTRALELGHPIVCLDSIRLALHGTPWLEKVEPLVAAFGHVMVDALFQAGHNNVILDSCNHTEKRRAEWHSPLWACRYHVVDTDAGECIRRALETDQEYLVPVINRMAAAYEPIGGVTDI